MPPRRVGLAALMALAALAACGGEPEVIIPPAAGLGEITGPYRSEPYPAIDPSVYRDLELQCRTLEGGMAIGGPDQALKLVDARGGGRLTLVFVGNGTQSECTGTIDGNGRVTLNGAGSSFGGPGPDLGPLELGPRSESSTSTGADSWTSVIGPAGSEVGAVTWELADGTRLVASMAGGWYAIWWPDNLDPSGPIVYDRAGVRVTP